MKKLIVVLLCFIFLVPTIVPFDVHAKEYRLADINRDGAVDIYDASIMMAHWGEHYPKADLNKDGAVNIMDASILISQWTG